MTDTDTMQWRTIESAPRDGTLIDVWVSGEFPGRRTDVIWREPTDSEWWAHGGDTIETPAATWHDAFGPIGSSEPITHWMPRPNPPAQSACERCGQAESSEHLNIHGNCPTCADDMGQ